MSSFPWAFGPRFQTVIRFENKEFAAEQPKQCPVWRGRSKTRRSISISKNWSGHWGPLYSGNSTYHEIRTDDGQFHQFNFLNGVALNKSNQDLKVNVIEYRCTNSKGKEMNWSWVTNIRISKTNALKLATGGRARWKIENETFNTLKNLGYNFEHNYGHGKKYLSTVFCMLMMLAFLIDQIQEACCSLFQKCKQSAGTYRCLWEEMRFLFKRVRLSSWETFYLVLVGEKTLDTSWREYLSLNFFSVVPPFTVDQI